MSSLEVVFDQLAVVARFEREERGGGGRSMAAITHNATITDRLIYTRIGNISTSSAVRHYVSLDLLPPSTYPTPEHEKEEEEKEEEEQEGGGRGSVVDLINFPVGVYLNVIQ